MKAFDWYLKSAQAGYVPAMRITAYMYAGLAVAKNEPESFHGYLNAAELGDKQSASVELYEEASKYQSHEYYFEAQTKLAWIYELGQNGIERDFTKADEYWSNLPPECKPARA